MPDVSSFDADDYVGLEFDEAKVLATGAGWDVRRLTADMVITLEFRRGRLNLTVDQRDVVVAAHLG